MLAQWKQQQTQAPPLRSTSIGAAEVTRSPSAGAELAHKVDPNPNHNHNHNHNHNPNHNHNHNHNPNHNPNPHPNHKDWTMSSDERVLRGITAGFTPPAADEAEAEGVPCLGIGKASTKSQVRHSKCSRSKHSHT